MDIISRGFLNFLQSRFLLALSSDWGFIRQGTCLLVSLCFRVHVRSRSTSYDVVLFKKKVCNHDGKNVHFIIILLPGKILHDLSHLDTYAVFNHTDMKCELVQAVHWAASILKFIVLQIVLTLAFLQKNTMSWNLNWVTIHRIAKKPLYCTDFSRLF